MNRRAAIRITAAGWLLLWPPLATSCRGKRSSSREHDRLVRQGHRDFDYVSDIRGAFDSVSFIANFGHPSTDQEWQTVFYVSGWFECVFAQKVEIRGGTLTPMAEPVLHVNEISRTDGRTFEYGRQKILEGDEIDAFIASGFDLARIGMPLTPGRAAPEMDFMRYWHELHPAP